MSEEHYTVSMANGMLDVHLQVHVCPCTIQVSGKMLYTILNFLNQGLDPPPMYAPIFNSILQYFETYSRRFC